MTVRQTSKKAVISGLCAFLAGSLLFVTFSDGDDYVHGFGKSCLFAHDGWHFHLNCGALSPPQP